MLPKRSRFEEFLVHKDERKALGERLGFTATKDWESITSKQIIESGGKGFLSKYQSSPSKLVMAIYDGMIGKWSDSTPWNNKSNQRTFLEALGEKLGFKQMGD